MKPLLLILCCLMLGGCGTKTNSPECSNSRTCFEKAEKSYYANYNSYYMQRAIYYATQEKECNK